jgi:hypothetical protein
MKKRERRKEEKRVWEGERKEEMAGRRCWIWEKEKTKGGFGNNMV